MLKPHCDVCDGYENVERHTYLNDRKSDGAGSMEDTGETYDLCRDCEFAVLTSITHELVRDLSKYKIAQIFIDAIKKEKKKRKEEN